MERFLDEEFGPPMLLRAGAGDDLLRPVRAGLHKLELLVQARLVMTVTQNWRREGKP